MNFFIGGSSSFGKTTFAEKILMSRMDDVSYVNEIGYSVPESIASGKKHIIVDFEISKQECALDRLGIFINFFDFIIIMSDVCNQDSERKLIDDIKYYIDIIDADKNKLLVVFNRFSTQSVSDDFFNDKKNKLTSIVDDFKLRSIVMPVFIDVDIEVNKLISEINLKNKLIGEKAFMGLFDFL